MTHTLILTRHAKSSWDDPFLSDHFRPLNKRGYKSARVVSRWLTQHGWIPDELISSTATRTRETWEHMGLSAKTVNFSRNLYHASREEMLAILTSATGNTTMLLGHNPGIADFAAQIVQDAPDHPRLRLLHPSRERRPPFVAHKVQTRNGSENGKRCIRHPRFRTH